MALLLEHNSYLKFNQLISSNTVAIAVSGGADSLAACLLLNKWCQKNKYKLVALTVNHGLRAEAEAEAKQVSAWLHHHNIEHHILTNQLPAPKNNIQEYARNIRYKLMTDFCNEHGIDQLVTAHHQDDQAETVLFRYVRAPVTSSLAGIEPIKNLCGITLVRPFLDTPKTELIAFLKKQGQPWVEDPSNESETHTRNRLRKALQQNPNYPSAREEICAIAKRMQQLKQQENNKLKELYDQNVTGNPTGFFLIKPSFWEQGRTESSLVLMHMLATCSGTGKLPRFYKVEHIFKTHKLKTKHTLHGCVLEKKENVWHLYREHSKIAPLDDAKDNIFDGRFVLPPQIMARDYIIKAASAQQINLAIKNGIKLTIPKAVAQTVPAFFSMLNLDTPLAIPHINYYDSSWIEGEIEVSPVRNFNNPFLNQL